MIVFALIVAGVLVFMVSWEYIWRRWPIGKEIGRKVPHITFGTFAAFWPFFLSWNQIRFLTLLSLAGILISKYAGIFKAVHSVERLTHGEVAAAAAVFALTFITHDKAIFAATMLLISLADGLAAIVGVHYGVKRKRGVYSVFGHKKTVIGTLTFLIVALLVLSGYRIGTGNLSVLWLVATALAATAAENIAVAGFDNLVVPLLVVFMLSHVG